MTAKSAKPGSRGKAPEPFAFNPFVKNCITVSLIQLNILQTCQYKSSFIGIEWYLLFLSGLNVLLFLFHLAKEEIYHPFSVFSKLTPSQINRKMKLYHIQ